MNGTIYKYIASISLLALLFSTAAANAQWISVTSGLPNVSNSLYSAGGKIYAANQTGLYFSTNNGIKWTKTSLSVNTSAVVRKDSVLIAGGTAGIFVSTNDGINWTQTYNSYYQFISMFTFGQYVFASNSYAILRSSNNGYNWTSVYPSGFNAVTSMTVNDNYIFAGTAGGEYSPGKILFTSNNGDNWINTSLDSVSVSAMNSLNGIVFAGTSSKGLFKSTNNGLNWINCGFQTYPVYGIFVIGTDLYLSTTSATSGNDFYKSTNNGVNWNIVTSVPKGKVISLSRLNSITCLGIEYGGVYVSPDNGVNWVKYMPLNTIINSFYKFNSRLFAGVTNGGVFYSEDGGANWVQSKLNPRLTIHSITSLGTKLFAGAFDYMTDTGGVYISSDNGVNWLKSSLNMKTIYTINNIDSVLYAGAAYHGIYKSTNNGLNWSGMMITTGCIPYCFYKRGPKIFTGMFRDNHFFYTGLYFSTNYGMSWDSVMNINSVDEITSNTTYLFAATNTAPGVIRSGNEGVNWSATSIDAGATCVTTSGNFLFAGTTTNGVYISTNNGDTWRIKNEGLTPGSVTALLIADDYIYTGDNSKGICRRLISDITAVSNNSYEVPTSYRLEQNYPNPFNPTTNIKFSIPKSGYVEIKIYDVLGKEMGTLVSDPYLAGTYIAGFNASKLASGVYFYRIVCNDYTQTMKMMILK